MNTRAGNAAQGREWERKAVALRKQVNDLFWQEDKGFFRTHLHLTPLDHPFDESDMVSIANAVAVRCGLAGQEQSDRIFRRLEEVREEAKANKPGIVLYPAYPAGTFATERMWPGHYQNGALWDWWAGWQILAEFESGYATLARQHLRQIAADWDSHPGQVFEWQTIGDNVGYGPDDYAGAAGTVGEAVVAGLFGVMLDRDGVELRPRLGDQPGFIRVYQPSSKRYAAYRYTPRPDVLYLDYGTDGPTPIDVGVLLPAGREVGEVRLDGQVISYGTTTVGRDRYATAEDVPPGIHRIVVNLKR
jgi:hypothetical protein